MENKIIARKVVAEPNEEKRRQKEQYHQITLSNS